MDTDPDDMYETVWAEPDGEPNFATVWCDAPDDDLAVEPPSDSLGEEPETFSVPCSELEDLPGAMGIKEEQTEIEHEEETEGDNEEDVEYPKNRVDGSRHLCNLCGTGFASFSEYQSHTKRHKEPGPYKCILCERTFPVKNRLLLHGRTHLDLRLRHCCEKCGANFWSPASLETHMKTHDGGGKKFKCDDCGKQFTREPEFIRHRRIHTGEKPHQCSQCGRAFSQQTNLARHMRLHTGEKPFKCLECGKAFRQSNILRLHMRLHTGEKPYECPVCKQRFAQRPHRHRHLQGHGIIVRTKSVNGRNVEDLIMDRDLVAGQVGIKENIVQKMGVLNDRSEDASEEAVDDPGVVTVGDNTADTAEDTSQPSETEQPELPMSQEQPERDTSVSSSNPRPLMKNNRIRAEVKSTPVTTDLSCPVCGRSFVRLERLRKHLQMHAADNPSADIPMI